MGIVFVVLSVPRKRVRRAVAPEIVFARYTLTRVRFEDETAKEGGRAAKVFSELRVLGKDGGRRTVTSDTNICIIVFVFDLDVLVECSNNDNLKRIESRS